MNAERLNYLAAQVKVAHARLDSATQQVRVLTETLREANTDHANAERELLKAEENLCAFVAGKEVAKCQTPASAMPGPPMAPAMLMPAMAPRPWGST